MLTNQQFYYGIIDEHDFRTITKASLSITKKSLKNALLNFFVNYYYVYDRSNKLRHQYNIYDNKK